jgi:hypothetical protein
MSERTFSVEEADALVPELRERLPRLREARRSLIEASERLSARVATDPGGVTEPAWFPAQQALRAEMVALAELGVVLRDPEIGLVDFPSAREGEPVFLCWKLGEERVAYYHGQRTGMSGRKPL